MHLSLTPTRANASALHSLTQAARRITVPDTDSLQTGFSVAFKNALHAVSAAQQHAAHLQNEVQLENPAVSLEETMLAMQKAQVGFQAALHVRNRMVQAYTDIMNMQV